MGYPFLEAFKSILPVCDELVVAVGDSSDKTREAILNLHPDKIKIIDTVWDMELRKGGKIFAQQTNVALDHTTGDWALHIQADEIVHEKDVLRIREYIEKHGNNPRVEALVFPFLHFWGSYSYIRTSRRVHRYEVRAFRNSKNIRSYKDSQGFRKYSSTENYLKGEKGKKLRSIKTDIPYYHYSYVRPPELMQKKSDFFDRFWHDDNWLTKKNKQSSGFQYEQVDKLEKFTGQHPASMVPIVEQQNWEFEFHPSQSNMRFKDRVLEKIFSLTGIRIAEYKNYKEI